MAQSCQLPPAAVGLGFQRGGTAAPRSPLRFKSPGAGELMIRSSLSWFFLSRLLPCGLSVSLFKRGDFRSLRLVAAHAREVFDVLCQLKLSGIRTQPILLSSQLQAALCDLLVRMVWPA